MPLVTQLTPATSYAPFSQTITVSTGISEVISSMTISKSPSSINGAVTALAYETLSVSFGSGPAQNFLTTDSLTYQGSANITLAGSYTDYMFPQEIKYYSNPGNIPVTRNNSVDVSSVNITRIVSDENADPKVNTYLAKQIKNKTLTTTDNRSQFYGVTSSWATVPKPVNALYSFVPYEGGPIDYFTYTISMQYTDYYGSGTSSFSLIHTVNYNAAYARQQFSVALSTQTGNTGGLT